MMAQEHLAAANVCHHPKVEEIRSFCENRISHFKTPKYVRFVDSFSMTATGKVQKFVLQRECMISLGISEYSNDRSQAGASG